MQNFSYAVVEEKECIVVLVNSDLFNLTSDKIEEERKFYSSLFSNSIIIFATQNGVGLTYNGRSDLVKYLANLHFRQLHFQIYDN